MSKVLVVTNDFPTRRGGIESFVLALCQRMDPSNVVVYTASMPDDKEYDATLPFPVYRDPSTILLPTPAVGRRAVRVMQEHGCDRVMFGASAPLGLLASRFRRAGAMRIVALTHGHEVWWAKVPVARQLLRRIGDSVDVMTYVSEWCRDQISPALSPETAAGMVRLTPGVETERFQADSGGDIVRKEWDIPDDAPLVVCAARLIKRKGQDVLIRSWPTVLAAVPNARLLLVGEGPDGARLMRLVDGLGVTDSVIFTGGVPWHQMPAYFDAGDVFAMPCRTRRFGLEPEALGIVFLEAAACSLPVLVGDSGGAGETVSDGETGHVVDPRSHVEIADLLRELLGDREGAAKLGLAGRDRVVNEWTWVHSSHVLDVLLYRW